MNYLIDNGKFIINNSEKDERTRLEKELKDYIDLTFDITDRDGYLRRKFILKRMFRSIGCDDVYMKHSIISSITIKFQDLLVPHMYTDKKLGKLCKREYDNWNRIDNLVEIIYLKKYISWIRQIIIALFNYTVQSCLNSQHITNHDVYLAITDKSKEVSKDSNG